MVFLELQREIWGFSQVMTGNSGSLPCCPRELQSLFELCWGAGDCSRVTAGESGLNIRSRGNIEVFLELQQETLASLNM